MGRSPDGIRREFMKVAEKVTVAELEKEDKKLEQANERTARRPGGAPSEETE